MDHFDIKSNTTILGDALKEVLSIASEFDIDIFLNYGALWVLREKVDFCHGITMSN